jgi:hypothetical protein
MALTKVRSWNNTEPGKTAQAVIMGIRGSTDGEAYVLETDPASGGGIPVSDPSLDVALSTRASEATLQLLKKWPYATYASITPTEDATNTYFTYKTSGGATVGTVTTNKSTGVITFSPNKVV